MSYLKNVICAAALLATCVPAMAINKCTGPDGKVVFQDAPCENKQTKKIAPPVTAPNFAASTPRPPIGDPAYEQARELAISKHIDAYAKSAGAQAGAARQAFESKCGAGSLEPRVGATAQWIRDCSSWGAPKSIRSITTALGKTEHWEYRNRGSLYFDANQKVSTILD